MAEIIPGLWLGKWTTSQDLEFLENEGITCIINCTNTFKFPAIPMRKIRIPILDNGSDAEVYKMYSLLDKAVTLIHRLLINKDRILVHCQAGQQRSVAIVLAFIIRYTNIDLSTAQQLIQTKWETANGLNFVKALRQYAIDIQSIKDESITTEISN